MKRYFLLCFLSGGGLSVFGGDVVPTYSLGVPRPASIRNTTIANQNEWLSANLPYVATGGFVWSTNAVSLRASAASDIQYMLTEGESGYSWERAKPEYYLADRIDAPKDVDWVATYDRYVKDGGANAVDTSGFLFNNSADDPCIYATEGGAHAFTWVMTDGTSKTMTYVIGANCTGRPRRIHWTDPPYNAPPIALTGKFVRFFGNQDILGLHYATVTNTYGGQELVQEKVVTQGLYLDQQSMVLYAKGKISGQVIMAYYDSGSYEKILAIQVLEVCEPQIVHNRGTIGTALKPDGRGYATEGLTAHVTAGIGNALDERGDYVYQHKGMYSYSPKTGDVFPIRPTTGDDREAEVEIYWMETDALGIQWPFEVDQYEIDWPSEMQRYVRGTVDDDVGAPILLPKSYTAELSPYQEPEGHARAPGGDGTFYTTGEGRSLLKITGDDNVWFMPIRSVLRTDTNYFTLASEKINVGTELRLRGGAAAGLAKGVTFHADPDVPGIIYKSASGALYDANLYYETTGLETNVTTSADGETEKPASAIFAIATNDVNGVGEIEVWWSEMYRQADMPEPINVPVLPQRYRPVWPSLREAPQIVLASQEGSANAVKWYRNGSARLAASNSTMRLVDRMYFPTGNGTLMFWTRLDHSVSGRLITLASQFAGNGGKPYLAVDVSGCALKFSGITGRSLPLKEWTHVAIVASDDTCTIYLNGEKQSVVKLTDSAKDRQVVAVGNFLGCTDGGNWAAPGVEIAEVTLFSRALSPDEIETERFAIRTGQESDVTGYYSFREGEDLVAVSQDVASDRRSFFDRVGGISCDAEGVELMLPGAPAKTGAVIDSETEPSLYVQNDVAAHGYNPNDEHAFVRTGSGGYVAWALRCDLATADTPPPGVFVEYVKGGRSRMQFFHVVATNETWPVLGASCVAGTQLPGPHPLDFFDNPWLPETKWDSTAVGKSGPAYRDRKGQVWARAAGDLDIRMYYAMQEGFWFPQRSADMQPNVGTPIPWLARLDNEKADPLTGEPVAWRWNVTWPENVPTMKIGQTLTVADEGLPEVWNAKSLAVVYPDPGAADKVVMLSDPTVMRSVDFNLDTLKSLGLTTDGNGGLSYRKGRYYFTELPPSVSGRLYLHGDGTTQKLCLVGERDEKNAGVSILYPNVLSQSEREAVCGLAKQGDCSAWRKAVERLASSPVEPTETKEVGDELRSTYLPVDHYALTALGGTNYVVLIENDSCAESMKDGSTCPVAEGDPISMRVLKVEPKYYQGKVVTREDEVNLLSQQLSIVYTEQFGGKADDFEFEWKSASPSADGTVSTNYDGVYQTRPVNLSIGESENGLTRIVIGQQGDTLANMVNKYWVCRYRAKDSSVPAYAVMGDQWSEWCGPALAEGWVQRVLNNVTPFNQRMTDLYENKAETAVSMLQQAGAPYEGDVALNQDNLTSVGLIQLYETILNKAESMSLLLGINDGEANKQLQLAVERLGDLYKVLGDEAYADAKNPTIGFGENSGVGFAGETSSLFCFDNQVNSLLDEELCLLRGRSGISAPSCRVGPYYNRLIWNFTKGITAGEVAYAVNYNVGGTETVALSEEQAARLYPQGHGDAYGHYLSALKGWYRLLRNPHFSWGRPVQTEMVIADTAVNVDYYEEAKFAEAAADLARTAADVVDLTARKAWRDDGATGAGYLDGNSQNAFGYGEWASRGAYGALVNWVVANSILPEDCADTAFNADYVDKGLTRIDRGTVDELREICDSAASIVSAVDRIDGGLNPLGLSDHAIPFDLSPSGASNGSNTHYEQVRDRAKTALANAKAVLDRAQTQSNRMRLVEETAESYSESIADQEADYEQQLIAIYGTPYSDDIGPSGTYKQGYEGPDLLNYMWMDLSDYGISESEIKDFVLITNVFSNLEIARCQRYGEIENYMNDDKGLETQVLSCGVTRTGLVKKPDHITGERRCNGSIQDGYAAFLRRYAAVQEAFSTYQEACISYQVEHDHTRTLLYHQMALTAAEDALIASKFVAAITENTVDIAEEAADKAFLAISKALRTIVKAVPSVVGAGVAVVTAPQSIAEAVTTPVEATAETAKEVVKSAGKKLKWSIGFVVKEAELIKDLAKSALTADSEAWSLMSQLKKAAEQLTSSYDDLESAVLELEESIDSLMREVAKGEALLAKRENARKRQVDHLSQLRYNEMLFRKFRDKTLSKYTAAFDLAQKYVFMAAQAYDYETALKREEDGSGDAFKAKIVAARSLGAFDSSGKPMVADDGDLGLAGYLAQMDANWQVMKPRLGINNPQPYATWFSLRGELFRILPDEKGDNAWAKELTKYWKDDILRDQEFVRHCQPFQSQFGLREKEPGLVIPFSTTIDFAKNLFGNDLAGGDHAYDSSWYLTRIAAAGVWFDGYNMKAEGAAASATPLLADTPVVYLVPIGYDCLRAPGQDDGNYWRFSVVDQVIPAPYAIGSYDLDADMWYPSLEAADWEGVDSLVKVRKHPSFRAYFDPAGGEPSDAKLDATRLIGRSVWNTRWLLIIPAGAMNADREKALSVFINGSDANRDGKLDLLPVRDIRIGFKTYSQSGN